MINYIEFRNLYPINKWLGLCCLFFILSWNRGNYIRATNNAINIQSFLISGWLFMRFFGWNVYPYCSLLIYFLYMMKYEFACESFIIKRLITQMKNSWIFHRNIFRFFNWYFWPSRTLFKNHQKTKPRILTLSELVSLWHSTKRKMGFANKYKVVRKVI